MTPLEPEHDRITGVERRRKAAALFAQGMTKLADVARELGISKGTASHWHRLWRDGGAAAFVQSRRRGRRSRLDPAALDPLRRSLDGSPRSSGFDLDVWSLAAIAALIRRATGVAYHPRHVPRILRRLGWVVAPVGPAALHAFRREVARDPDGNALSLCHRFRRERRDELERSS